jgi:polyferredoxin
MLLTSLWNFLLCPIGVMFDILFNLHKFMRFEARDPFQEKLRREEHRSDWDRYAHIEYNRLAQEEEG